MAHRSGPLKEIASLPLAMTRLAVLVSGNGSNLQAIIDACEQNKTNATVAVVISNKANAYALERAKKHQIPAFVFPSGKNFESSAFQTLQEKKIDLVCLAGFMKILSPSFVARFPNRIINIHPSLLPAFPGLDAQEQALKSGEKVTGATVHFVDEGCDTGPIILQKEVPILEDDDVASLRKRILKVEHEIYPEAIRLIATASLK
ncbi:MAG: phosphoribosylglycinamide formyltransferase [Deltaproteobacteria bacterium]|nr:phosphoribosylglycinamide formyltransferase [Deltaproteobacteria bacterium]